MHASFSSFWFNDSAIISVSVSLSVIMPPCVLWLQYQFQFYHSKAVVQTVGLVQLNFLSSFLSDLTDVAVHSLLTEHWDCSPALTERRLAYVLGPHWWLNILQITREYIRFVVGSINHSWDHGASIVPSVWTLRCFLSSRHPEHYQYVFGRLTNRCGAAG